MYKKFPIHLLIGLLIAAAVTILVMLAWNYVMPAVFKLPEINLWQTLALIFLSKIFFSSFHGGPRGFRWNRRRHEEWHRRFEERLSNMDPEEREFYREARNKLRRRWRTWEREDRDEKQGKTHSDKENSGKNSSGEKA